MLRTLSFYFLGLLQAYIMGQKDLKYFIFFKSSKYYSINKFYETTSIITNKKGHKKWDTFLGSSKKHTDIYHRNIPFLATKLFKVAK